LIFTNMKRSLSIIAACLALSADVPPDAIVISSEEKTVQTTITQEWRSITFVANSQTGEINVRAVYELVARTDGVPTSATPIRDVEIPWAQATNIAPALVLVREQFRLAMSTILTNASP